MTKRLTGHLGFTGYRGFTLVEIMIAMFIMSFLSLFTSQAIQKALSTRTKIQKEIDKTSMVRDALRIMERDINLAFNYRDINTALYNQAQTARLQKAQGASAGVGTSTPQANSGFGINTPNAAVGTVANPERYQQKQEKLVTHFLGDAQSLDFTTVSNIRMLENSPISSQAEIGYSLKPCRKRSTQVQASQCLWRRISNYIHDDITREGQQTVLLENVKELRMRYLGPAQGSEQEWLERWFSNQRGDDQTKNRFPIAVEITLSVQDSGPNVKDKVLTMTTVAAIRNPNNPPNNQSGNQSGNQQTNGAAGQPNQTQTPPQTPTSTSGSTPGRVGP